LGHTRAALSFVCEKAIEEAANRKKRNVEGQISLFEIGGLQVEPSMSLPDIKEFDDNARYAMEKEMTGVYITGHPLQAYTKFLEKFPVSVADIKSEDSGPGLDGQETVLMGIVTERRTRATRQNAMMGYYVLEDLTGALNLLAFPRTLESVDKILQVDGIVLVRGRISMREEEEPSFVIESAIPFNGDDAQLDAFMKNGKRPFIKPREQPLVEETKPKGKTEEHKDASASCDEKTTLWLRLRSFDNDFQMAGLMGLLEEYPGSAAVKAYALDSKRSLRLKTGVSPHREMLQLLSDYLGAENVKLVRGE
jgi:DNA polymerase III alpha subunit